MWDVDNTTPFPHVGTFLRDAQGASLWLVGVKATFTFRPGKPCLFTPDQIDPHFGPLFADDDTRSDMLADTDVTLPKDKVDVLVDATAYPPRDVQMEQPFLAQFGIGPLTKAIQVAPPLTMGRWQGATPTKNVRPTPVPLRYGQSFGGLLTPDNPVGLGDDPKAERDTMVLPRLSQPGKTYDHPKSPIAPIGLNAIPRSWPARVALGGTYDATWERRRAPLLPADLKSEFWQAAPPDQRLDRSALDKAQITLTNMTSADGEWAEPPITFPLPYVGLDISTNFRGKRTTLHPELQTVLIEGDTRHVSLFYLATLPIEAAQNDVLIDKTIVALSDSSGFRVLPEHASLFGRQVKTEEAA